MTAITTSLGGLHLCKNCHQRPGRVQLERDGIIERRLDKRGRTTAYELTAAGDDLAFVLAALTHWVNRWVMDDPEQAELDPRLLMLWFSRIVEPSGFGDQRLVVEFQLHGPRPGRSWLVVEGGEVSLCLDDPCLDIDLRVSADTATLYQVFMGRLALSSAVADDLIKITGATPLVRSFLQLMGQTSPPYMTGVR